MTAQARRNAPYAVVAEKACRVGWQARWGCGPGGMGGRVGWRAGSGGGQDLVAGRAGGGQGGRSRMDDLLSKECSGVNIVT